MATEEEKVLNFFQSQVNRSGYNLQVRVENKLRKKFDVFREVPYLDKDDLKGRYLDLKAIGYIPSLNIPVRDERPIIAHLRMSIECKSLSDHGWVFFEGIDEGFLFHDLVTAGSIKIEDVMGNYAPTGRFPNLFHANSYAEYIRDNKADQVSMMKSNKRTDNLYEAVHTVTKANRYDIENFESSLKYMIAFRNEAPRLVAFALFQPIVVFEGRMYSARLVGENMVLEPIKYAKIPKRYASASYNETEGYVHIVSYQSLDEYLELVKNYYWSKSNNILNSQELLSQKIASLKWSDFAPP